MIERALKIETASKDRKMFFQDDGACFGIVVTGQGQAAIIVNKIEDFTLGSLHVAAMAASVSSKPVEHAEGFARVTVKVGICITHRNIQEAMNCYPSNQDKCQEKKCLELHCFCIEPDIYDKPKIACTKCKDIYHQGCIGPVAIKEDWLCYPCTLPVKGATWSAGLITNTCSIDNMLSVQSLLAKQNSKFLQQFDDRDMSEKTWKRCVEAVMDDRYTWGSPCVYTNRD